MEKERMGDCYFMDPFDWSSDLFAEIRNSLLLLLDLEYLMAIDAGYNDKPVPIIETAVITLAHLSLHTEDVEVECLFMISVVAAIEPSQQYISQ
ncbi:hypothetical protein ABZP36_022733 [Zizania latifolia]